MAARIFLLSPASCTGTRAEFLLSPRASFPLALQLRSASGAPLGDVFSFISQLYFRGKLAYARAFADTGNAGTGLGDGVFVITPSRGIMPWQARVGADTLREFAAVEVRRANAAYANALTATAGVVGERLPANGEAVLLGSIASDKYAEALAEVFGTRLLFPSEFVGRGDMSRGGLMLRRVREGRELEYVRFAGSPRHGARPPRLERQRR